MKNLFYSIFLVTFLSACWDTPRVDTQSVRDEMQSRKITYATKGDLTTEAEELGFSIIKGIKSGEVDADSLSKMGVAFLAINDENMSEALAIETQIFEAYRFTYENDKLLAGENIQYDDGTYYITYPEIIDSTFTMWSLRLSEKALILN